MSPFAATARRHQGRGAAGVAAAGGRQAAAAVGSTRCTALRVTEAEVLAALETLYLDQVRPSAAVLLRRLGERAAAPAGAPAVALPGRGGGVELVPRIDVARLRQVCERSPRIEVVQEGGEYAALLRGRPEPFVDTSSNCDPYPEAFWREAAAFFGPGGVGHDLAFPGGRYACARELVAHDLPFLRGYSLGQVCHIVQLAIWQRSLLGHAGGKIVAYERSESVVKHRCAERQEAAPRKDQDATLAVADLATARATLALILGRCGRPVPLPNVKRVFRAEFRLDLSETAFGHRRLWDLLEDPRFSDICSLRMEGTTCVVVPRATGSPRPAAPATTCTEADTPISPWETSHTFIHFKAPPPTPLLMRRTQSVPAGARVGPRAAAGKVPSDSDSDVETASGGGNSQIWQAPSRSDSDGEECAEYGPPTPSPRSPAHLRGRYSPGASPPFCLADVLAACQAHSPTAEPPAAPEQAPRPFAVEPLPLDFLEADVLQAVGGGGGAPLGDLGFPTPSPQYGFDAAAAARPPRPASFPGAVCGPTAATPVQDFPCVTPTPRLYHLAR